jgi:hypothetical protein
VVDLEHTATDPEIPELERTAYFDATLTRAEKQNVLFLAEGFRSTDRDAFNKICVKLIDVLLDSERNQPYKMLKDGFNFWKFFRPSNEHGSTVGAPIIKRIPTGDPPIIKKDDPYKLFIDDKLPLSSSPIDAYSLYELVKIVGYPTLADETRTVNKIKNDWASTLSLIGYEDTKVCNDIVEAWKLAIPIGLVDVRDTYFGFIQSNRLGDRKSVKDKYVNMIKQASLGDPATEISAFARHLYQWFQPQTEMRRHDPDPRRYAPEIRSHEVNFLIEHLTKLTDPLSSVGDDHYVGKLWNSLPSTSSAVKTRQFNSAGLVCMLVNHEYEFGWNNVGYMITMSIGSKLDLHININTSNPDRRSASLNPVYIEKLKSSSDGHDQTMADILAHEFGHAFRLGDEYEEFQGAPEADDIDVSYDNITHLKEIANTSHSFPGCFPTPIVPGSIKWAKVHRITKADTLIEPSVINGNQIIVTLEKGRAQSWRTIKDNNTEVEVLLRKYVQKQFPVDEKNDLYQGLIIQNIPDDHTLELTAKTTPVSFPAGSVIYVPKKDNGDISTLVKNPVLIFMENQNYDPAASPSIPNGIALSTNYNSTDPTKSDEPHVTADYPPWIPGFTEPCQRFKLIGAYEGGYRYTINVFRPSGACKMRAHYRARAEGEFCFVCKYLLVNRIDPSKHGELDALYPDGKDK